MPEKTNQKTVDLSAQYNDSVTQIFKNEYLSPRSPFCSLAIPKQGIGGWCYYRATAEIDDTGLRQSARENNNTFNMPQGFSFGIPGDENKNNIMYVSLWDNYPNEATVPLEGKAAHVYLLMAGSTNWMQCRIDNGEVMVSYQDGATDTLTLRSPTNWWLIEQDYYIDDYAFSRPEPIPPRVELKTGRIHIWDVKAFREKVDALGLQALKRQAQKIPGGAATVLDLPLDSGKELKSLTVRTLSNEVVIGLMGVTLVQD
jgi:hypothetical protein